MKKSINNLSNGKVSTQNKVFITCFAVLVIVLVVGVHTGFINAYYLTR